MIVIYLLLLSQCLALENICEMKNELSESKLIPHYMGIKYEEYLKKHDESMKPIFLFCGLSLANMLPFAPSLYSVILISSIFIDVGQCYHNITSYASNAYQYDEFMKTQPKCFYDYIPLGDYDLYAQFRYTSDTQHKKLISNTILEHPITVYKDGKLILEC